MVFQRRLKNKSGTYLVEVESYRQNGKIKQRYVRYVGKEVDGKKILSSSISNIEIESVKVYGPLMVLNQIAQEINLSKILGEYGDEILSMAYAHCVEPKSVNQMESWFEKTDLNFILDLHSLTESQLYCFKLSVRQYIISKKQLPKGRLRTANFSARYDKKVEKLVLFVEN